MNILYITGEINDNLVDHFIKEYNKLDKSNPIVIYINTMGGDVYHAEVIIDIINNNKDNITLIASGEIYSAGFNIFFFSKCAKKLLPEALGMAHFAWSIFQFDESGKPSNDQDKFLMTEMKRSKDITIKRFEAIGLTPKEISKIKQSKECYFSNERLHELLKYGNKED